MRNENQRKSLSSSSLQEQDCDVDLGLKMQRPRTASYSCENGAGNPFFTYHQPHIYELANGVLLQRSLDNAAASRASVAGAGGMNMIPMCGKALFTTSQLQELERQKMIHKYMLASIPVPPQLLMSISAAPPPPSLSQCNTAGLDLRFPSSGSDPEAWRCKRTDGKKWRCSRDVAPDQKYCERHAHKNRPRSRKHVENSPHSFSHNKPNNSTTLPRPTSHFPATSYDQTRCIEWLMRGGNTESSSSSSPCKQPQWDELISSSRMELNRDKDDNLSVYHPQFADTQDFTSLSPITTTDQTTRLFIDAWGKDGVEDGMSGSATAKERAASAASAERKAWPSSSLSLSMSRMDDKGDLGIGMMMSNSSTSSSTSSEGGIMKNHHHHHQWLNPGGSWMNSSAPGGPLGEALCLGNANISTNRGGYCNFASLHDHDQSHQTHGYSYSNSNSNTNTSSRCSKSSCEDGSHALNFIG